MEQNHRNGDHMEGYQQGRGGETMGEKVQGIKSINGRYKIDRGRLRIVWEMEKPKNLYVQPTDMNQGEGMMVGVGYSVEGNKGKKKWDNYNSCLLYTSDAADDWLVV